MKIRSTTYERQGTSSTYRVSYVLILSTSQVVSPVEALA